MAQPPRGAPARGASLYRLVNLLYAAYSCSLAVRAERSRAQIRRLAVANLAWVPVCLGLAVVFWEPATGFGIAHLVGEAVFVGGLGMLEWSQREHLLRAS